MANTGMFLKKQIIVFTMDGKLFFYGRSDQLRPRPTSQRIIPTINTTTKIPTHTPALKIPPTTLQDSKAITVAKAKSPNNEYCFMSSSFWGIVQNFCRSTAYG